MQYSADEQAAALGLAKIRNPAVSSRPVLRSLALRLLADYGGAGVVAQMHYIRRSEVAKWTGIEWRARPRLSRAAAEVAGMERAAREAPWLFAAERLDLDPDVPPGRPSMAPTEHVGPGGDPRPGPAIPNQGVAHDAGIPAGQPRPVRVSRTRDGRTRVEVDDDSIYEHCDALVRLDSPHLSGPARRAEVARRFALVREAARRSALEEYEAATRTHPHRSRGVPR